MTAPAHRLRHLHRDEDPPQAGPARLLARLARELAADLIAIGSQWGPAGRLGLTRAVLAYHTRLATGRLGGGAGPARLRRIRLRPRPAGAGRTAAADCYFRPTASDLHVLREVFVHRAYEYPYEDVIGPVRRVLDLGSNIGVSGLYFSLRFPEAELVCVEPVEQNVAVLRHNARANRLPWRIEAVAVAAAAGRTELYASRWWASSSTTKAVAEARRALPHRPESVLGGQVAQVPTATVDDLLARAGWDTVDVVKMDIEGAEREVLLDVAPHWLERTGVLVLDIHAKYVPRDRIVATLAEYGLHPAADHGAHASVFIRAVPRTAPGSTARGER